MTHARSRHHLNVAATSFEAMAVRLLCFSPPVLQWSALFQIRFASDFTRLFSGRLLCTIILNPPLGPLLSSRPLLLSDFYRHRFSRHGLAPVANH